MAWRESFSSTIISRGFSYFRQKRVKGVMRDGNQFNGKVQGTHLYSVHVELVPLKRGRKKDYYINSNCNCAYGGMCKHAAALMYHIENTYDIQKLINEQIQDEPKLSPFQAPKRIQYFDLSSIQAKDGYDESVCKKASDLYKKKQIKMLEVESGYLSNDSELCAKITATTTVNNRYSGAYNQIGILMDRRHVIEHRCGVYGCANYNYYYMNNEDLCEHELTALKLFEDYQEEHEVGDFTGRTALDFIYAVKGSGERLRRFRQNLKEKQENAENVQKEQVELEPRIERGGDKLYFYTKIGLDKMYVVNNMTNLVEARKGKRVYPLGKKNEIDFSYMAFTPESKVIFDFIQQEVSNKSKEYEYIQEKSRDYYYECPDFRVKSFIELQGETLDQFFRLFENKKIEYIDKTNGNKIKQEIKVTNKSPMLQMTLEKMEERGTFLGMRLHGEVPQCFRGEEAGYYLGSSHLYRFSAEEYENLKPILDHSAGGILDLQVGTNYLADFYRTVLPVVEQAVEIERKDEEMIQEYLPVEPRFCFYFDAEDGNVFVKAEVTYREKVWELREMFQPTKDLGNRDLEYEKAVCNELEKYCPFIDSKHRYYHCNKDEDLIYKVTHYGLDHFATIGDVKVTDAFNRISVKNTLKLKVGISLKSDLLNLDISSGELSMQELLGILDSFRRKKKYHRLQDGSFLSIEEDESIEMLSKLYDELHLSPKEFVKGKMKIPVYRALYLDKMLEGKNGLYTERDRNFKRLVKEFKTVDDSDFEVPESLAGIMRNYQVHGFKWMKTVATYGFGGILADDMGLGKTLQTIALLLSAKENEEKGTSLICCPASLVYNWQEECSRFAPSLRVGVLGGTPKERKALLQQMEAYDLLVTSYDALKRDIVLYEDVHFLYEIIDEAQFIKTQSTAVSKSVKLINAKHRFALTGTPIENRLSELWSIFDYLMPGYLYSYDNFRQELETAIVKYQDQEATERLKRMVSPFIVRRLKTDVLTDLPSKLEEVRMARFSDEQQKIYDAQVVRLKQMIETTEESEFSKSKIQVLAELTRIRQICCDPSLYLEDYSHGSAKTEACLDLIDSAIEGNHKMLVFSQFTSMLDILRKRLTEKGIAYYVITGETKKQERLELVKQFNEDETPVFLISLKAGGTGLNLTGADVVIHFDPWWNQAVQNQATDRAHRIGQTKTVTVYKLIVKNSIEERILQMQEMKKNLADEILSGENGSLGSLSKEELLELLH